jgi:mannosyltransferase OCH1-like enzyme
MERSIYFLLLCITIFILALTPRRERFLDEFVPPTILQNYEELVSFLQSQTHSQWKIPKVLYRTWKSFDGLPEEFFQIIKSNVDGNKYVILFFDDESCRRFINDFRPDCLDAYDALVPGAYRADLWRLVVLHTFGGIYNDIGHEYLAPIENIIHDSDEIVLTREIKICGIHNAFMAARKNHPLIGEMITQVLKNIEQRLYGECPIDITGPKALGKVMTRYFNMPHAEVPSHYGYCPNTNIKLFDFVRLDRVIRASDGIDVISTKSIDFQSLVTSTLADGHYAKFWYNNTVYAS